MKSQTKILVMGGILAMGAASSVQAATACSGTAGNGTQVVGATGSFVKDSFTPKCSANVTVAYTDSVSMIAVRGGSSKGMHTFGGTSEGGGILQCESSSAANPHTTAATVSATNGCP